MRIVIVEDEAPIRNGMGNILQKINPDYELAGKASNGIEGLELIRREQPDLVIMDIRMPDMDGLTMLRSLRDEGNQVKAIVLSAYSEFSYAREAIELGIENYLLKPIKLPELESALNLACKHIRKAKHEKDRFTLDHVFLEGAAGTFISEDGTREFMQEEYGLDIEETIGVFMIFLGEHYREYGEEVYREIRKLGEGSGLFKACALKNDKMQRIVSFMYSIGDRRSVESYLENTVVPMVAAQTGSRAVMGLHYCGGIVNVQHALVEIYQMLDYSLVLGSGKLICYSEIMDMEYETFRYPLEVERRGKQAVASRDYREVEKCFHTLFQMASAGRYRPGEIKEACIKFCYALMNTAKECGSIKMEEFSSQKVLESITLSVTWEQMKDKLRTFYRQLILEEVKADDENLSLLIRRADNLIKEFYSQGITLDEIARKLGVSEEYLSAQYKKEKGVTYTETIKKYRVEKIKELLLTTNLKLTQIAEKTGYADSKYMSKVFKEETGTLPLEYRKINS